MNSLERSLCRTCVHVNDCSLTSNKRFIWSCSEYEHKDAEKEDKKETVTIDFDFMNSEKKVELIY